jgi:hypothetical protein
MGDLNKSPKDLAETVHKKLKLQKLDIPNIKILTELFETLYYTSLTTEEQKSISCYVIYISSENPDPKPPKRIRHNRWGYTKFADYIPLSTSNLIKLARASDPRSSAFAVYHNKERGLYIWGIIDHSNEFHDFLNYNSDEGPERPGIFQANINKIGHLTIYNGYEKIAELKTNILIEKTLNALESGQVFEALEPGIKKFILEINRQLPKSMQSEWKEEWEDYFSEEWITVLYRLILRIQSYGHGGAFLITPDKSFKHLSIKYRIEYKRLQKALVKYASSTIQERRVSNIIDENYIHKLKDIPGSLYLDHALFGYDIEDSRYEIDGGIWFISLLSRVDGLVLLNQQLEVEGFGVEIMCNDEPEDIFITDNENAKKGKLNKLDYKHYGTRHRSMMRYCSLIPGSVGFVISQDGEVRAMTQVNNKLVIWENLRLQLEFNVN